MKLSKREVEQIHRDAELAWESLTESECPGPDQIEWAKFYLHYILELTTPTKVRKTTDRNS